MAELVVSDERRLERRLRPLFVAIGLQGLLLWLPIEKLFLTEIGFTAVSIGVMAAAYSAVVPLLEMPSGVLADRWSRRGLLAAAVGALFIGTAICGLSHGVATYIGGAALLGVYFALGSGTVESMVYDTVVEETGQSELFERWLGRVRGVESLALVISALAGGVLATHTSPRFTYIITLPVVGASIIALVFFREPRLHKENEPIAIRAHMRLALSVIAQNPVVAQVALLSALVTMLASAIYEFGPLWLVAVHAPMAWYGPYSAAVFGMVAVGGFASGHIGLHLPTTLVTIAALTFLSAIVLALTNNLALIVAAQVCLAMALVLTEVRVGQVLHDAVSSQLRTGVASGVSTMAWILFIPLALSFGWLVRQHGIHAGGWILAGIATVLSVQLTRLALRPAARVTNVPAESI